MLNMYYRQQADQGRGQSQRRMQSWGSGDWMCGACQHLNFKKRDQCQRCEYPKYGGPDPSTHAYKEVLAGDWYCHCGAHNYASRSHCFVCAALKPDYAGHVIASEASAVPPGWKNGDWCCARVGCGTHNYASRTACYKCKTPKDYGM